MILLIIIVTSRIIWIVTHITPDVQEKIKKLLDIWEKGQTFPTLMIESFKDKLSAPPPPPSTSSSDNIPHAGSCSQPRGNTQVLTRIL